MRAILIYRELNLTVKYVTFNHQNMSSNLIALKNNVILSLETSALKG